MRALVAAVLCCAMLAGTVYLAGRSIGAWDDQATAAAAAAAPKVTKAQKRANKPTIWLNGRDQRAARAAVLTKADLGVGWKGGAKKVDFSLEVSCPNYRPRAWDLQITGAAATHHTHVGGVQIRSEAWVMQSPRMARLDWKRSMEHPNMLRCMRRLLARGAAQHGETFVSMNRRPFPRIAPHTARFRVISKVKVRRGRTIPVLWDMVVLVKGRHELGLTVIAPLSERAAADKAEVRLAKLLLARVRS